VAIRVGGRQNPSVTDRILIVVAAWYAALSVVSFCLYGFDKWRAGRNGWRIKERTLLSVDLIGGWPGGLAGRMVFRHKTRKGSYRVRFWTIVVAHLLIWGVIGTRVLDFA